MEHATADELTAGLAEILRSPSSDGTLELIVRRPAVDEREVLDEGALDPAEGLVGDRWHLRESAERRHTADVDELAHDRPDRR